MPHIQHMGCPLRHCQLHTKCTHKCLVKDKCLSLDRCPAKVRCHTPSITHRHPATMPPCVVDHQQCLPQCPSHKCIHKSTLVIPSQCSSLNTILRPCHNTTRDHHKCRTKAILPINHHTNNNQVNLVQVPTTEELQLHQSRQSLTLGRALTMDLLLCLHRRLGICLRPHKPLR